MNLYTSSRYLKKNPSYHLEDSLYKHNNFIKILKKNNFIFKKVKSIIDVGCGIGEILKYLKKNNLFLNASFAGYDVNKYAIKFAKKNSDINFFCENYKELSKNKKSDLIICADVFEHVDNDVYFLKKLLNNGKFFLFNVPLDISLISLIKKNFFKKKYNDVGHIHFYSKYSIILKIEHCGYKIIDKIYAKNRLKHFTKKGFSIKKFLIIPFQYILDKINEDFACAIFGGYSLVILAKNPKWK